MSSGSRLSRAEISATLPLRQVTLHSFFGWMCAFSVMSDSFSTLWTVACQASVSMGFSRLECWSGLPFPLPGDLPNLRIKPASLTSPALAGGFFTTSTTWEAPGFFNLLISYSLHVHLEIIIVPVMMSKAGDAGTALSVVLTHSDSLWSH